MKIDLNKYEYLTKPLDALGQMIALGQGDAYLVGGCVRDIIMGVDESKDYDIVTNIPMDVLEDNFNTADIGASRDFGILAVIIDGEVYEVAQMRTDGDSSNNRHPDSVETEGVTVETDSCRRDLTMNAMYLTADGEILDFHNGIEDIDTEVIQFVGNPLDRLHEDALRLIRVLRFASTTEMLLSESTHTAICDYLIDTTELKAVAIERFTAELFKVASAGGRAMSNFISVLDEYDLLDFYLPELTAMKTSFHYWQHHPEGSLMTTPDGNIEATDVELVMKFPSEYTIFKAGNVLEHTVACLDVLPIESTTMEVMAVLLHDIGKPPTAKVNSRDPDPISHSFHGHATVGVDVFEVMAKRLKLSNDVCKELSFCIRHHLEFFRMMDMKKSKVIKIAMSPYCCTLISVAWADDQSRGAYVSRIEEWKEVCDMLDGFIQVHTDSEELKAKVQSRINGKMVLDLRPQLKGRIIGEIITYVTEELINSDFQLSDDAITDTILNYGNKGE